jgi:hypothetical protein
VLLPNQKMTKGMPAACPLEVSHMAMGGDDMKNRCGNFKEKIK